MHFCLSKKHNLYAFLSIANHGILFFVNPNNHYRITCHSCDIVPLRETVALVHAKYTVSIRRKVLTAIWFKSPIVIRRK